MFSVKQDLTIASASAPYENWSTGHISYTVPVDVLIDGDLTTDPNKGPYCYTSTGAESGGTPHVKLEMKQVTKVDKVRLLERDQFHPVPMDQQWGQYTF